MVLSIIVVVVVIIIFVINGCASTAEVQGSYEGKHLALCQIILQDGMVMPKLPSGHKEVKIVYDASKIKYGCIYVVVRGDHLLDSDEKIIARHRLAVVYPSTTILYPNYDVIEYDKLEDELERILKSNDRLEDAESIVISGCPCVDIASLSRQLGGKDFNDFADEDEAYKYLSSGRHKILSTNIVDTLAVKHMFAIKSDAYDNIGHQCSHSYDAMKMVGFKIMSSSEISKEIRKIIKH